MTDYAEVYQALDTTLRQQCDVPNELDRLVDRFLRDNDGRSVSSDDDFHWVMVYVAFYSGMNAKTVTERMPIIREYLHGYKRVSAYDEEMVKKMLGDERMLRNEKKVRASIQNARAVGDIVLKYGSFRSYLDSFNWRDSPENLVRLRNDLMARFEMLKKITSFHFMMDVGLPVIKPDRVIMRVFERLGLIPNRDQSNENLLEVVRQGILMSEAAGKPTRQIDIMLVSLGQVGGSPELGTTHGVCLEKSPLCLECGLRSQCIFFKNLRTNPG
jgi:DNA-3-methyladenine glycosylase I